MADFTFSELTPTAFLELSERVFGHRTAVVDGEVRLTYAELGARSRALTGLLAALGVGPGDLVAALCTNSHVMLELHHGVPLRGAVLGDEGPIVIHKRMPQRDRGQHRPVAVNGQTRHEPVHGLLLARPSTIPRGRSTRVQDHPHIKHRTIDNDDGLRSNRRPHRRRGVLRRLREGRSPLRPHRIPTSRGRRHRDAQAPRRDAPPDAGQRLLCAGAVAADVFST